MGGIAGMGHFPTPFIRSIAAGLAPPCKWENFVVNINSAFADLSQKLQPVCGWARSTKTKFQSE